MTGSQFLEKGCWERGVTFFGVGEGVQFLHKNTLKSEIVNAKKSLLAKIFFSVITKNLNWEILIKNLITFKGQMGLKMKNFRGFTEKSNF